MGGNKILEMTREDYLDKTGVKENKQLSLSGYQQDSPCSGSSCKTFVSSGGEKKATNLLPSNAAPPNLFYLLPREESLDPLFHSY